MDKTMTEQEQQAEASSGASELTQMLGEAIAPAQAIAALRHAMKRDPGYAWTWHCNVAMVAIDAGAEHKEANDRAADFMRRAFDVDTTQRP